MTQHIFQPFDKVVVVAQKRPWYGSVLTVDAVGGIWVQASTPEGLHDYFLPAELKPYYENIHDEKHINLKLQSDKTIPVDSGLNCM